VTDYNLRRPAGLRKLSAHLEESRLKAKTTKMYADKTLTKYLDDLAAKLPAPGGGSAAALSAALGASLISMVINFTLGKPKYARYEEDLREMFKISEKLRQEFLNLVDLDITAYESKNLKDALDIPFMVCRLCFEGIKLCGTLTKRGNPRLISDVGVGAVLLEAAFAAANFNVEINLTLPENKKFAGRIRKELRQKEKMLRKMRQETEENVGKIIRG